MTLRHLISRARLSLLSNSSSKSLVRQGFALGILGGLTLGVGAHASRARHHGRHTSSPGVQPHIAPAFSATPDLESALSASEAPETSAAPGQRFELKLHHLHTGEDIDVVYRVGNTYLPGAISQLNHFLRDHRTQDVSHYDPHEFDLLHNVLARLGRPNGVIDIVCGYRTPWSNNYLRTRASVTGVAKNSQHVQAKAIDIRIPGVATRVLRDVALSLHGGGVGYYPISQFVHVDVGPVRQWSFGGRSGD